MSENNGAVVAEQVGAGEAGNGEAVAEEARVFGDLATAQASPPNVKATGAYKLYSVKVKGTPVRYTWARDGARATAAVAREDGYEANVAVGKVNKDKAAAYLDALPEEERAAILAAYNKAGKKKS